MKHGLHGFKHNLSLTGPEKFIKASGGRAQIRISEKPLCCKASEAFFVVIVFRCKFKKWLTVDSTNTTFKDLISQFQQHH